MTENVRYLNDTTKKNQNFPNLAIEIEPDTVSFSISIAGIYDMDYNYNAGFNQINSMNSLNQSC